MNLSKSEIDRCVLLVLTAPDTSLTSVEICERISMLEPGVPISALLQSLIRLKARRLIEYADVSRSTAELALANALRIAESLDDDDAPLAPCVTRFRITKQGLTLLSSHRS